MNIQQIIADELQSIAHEKSQESDRKRNEADRAEKLRLATIQERVNYFIAQLPDKVRKAVGEGNRSVVVSSNEDRSKTIMDGDETHTYTLALRHALVDAGVKLRDICIDWDYDYKYSGWFHMLLPPNVIP